MSNLSAMEAQRFEELKAKGFKNLEGIEREEYKKYLALDKGQDPSDTVTMSKAELQKMLDDAAQKNKPAITTQLANPDFQEFKEKPKPKPTATLRKWRKDSDSPEGLLIKSIHHSFQYDEDSRKHDKDIYKFTFLMPDGKEQEVLLPYIELTKMNDVETVTIINMPKKTLIKDKWNGRKQYAFKRHVSKDKTLIEQNDEVKGDIELNVQMDGYPEGATVELGDGRIITVPASALNA